MATNEQIINEYKAYSKYRSIFFIGLGGLYLIISFIFRNNPNITMPLTIVIFSIFFIGYYFSNKKKKTILNQVNAQDEKAVDKINTYLLEKDGFNFNDLNVGYMVRKGKFKPITYVLKDNDLTIYEFEITKVLIYRYGASKLYSIDTRKSELDKIKSQTYKDVTLEKTKLTAKTLLDSVYRQVKDEGIKDVFFDREIIDQIQKKEKDFISANQAIYACNKAKLREYQIDKDTKVYI